jgi:propionate CoA-transferase
MPRDTVSGAGAPAARTEGKIKSAREAARLIRSGDTVATGGFVGIGFPEAIAVALEARFLDGAAGSPDGVGEPRDLSLVYAAGQGDGKERGLNHLAHRGLVRRVIGGTGPGAEAAGALRLRLDRAYNLPQGVITHLYRDIAAGKPGHSQDRPRTRSPIRGTAAASQPGTTADLVSPMQTDGRSISSPLVSDRRRHRAAHRRSRRQHHDGARGADAGGPPDVRPHTTRRPHHRQVERIAERGSLNPRQVKIPGIMVDCVVVAERREDHMQTFAEFYSAAFAGEMRVPMSTLQPLEMDERKIIARRAALELEANAVVNLGIGMPEGISAVAAEEGVTDLLTLTAEPGVIGGIPASGLNFGAAINAQAVIDQPYQFDFYDGGGLDCAFLGLAQVDRHGNLNVSRFGARLAGAGGFVNISQSAKAVVFVGTFTAGPLAVQVAGGRLVIAREGDVRKFVSEVEHRTFSGDYALKRGQPVLYVTERCVFRLTQGGLELVEVAPGIDIDRDILAHMDFAPIVRDPQPMDARIFATELMGLRDRLAERPFEERFSYDPRLRMLFIDLRQLAIRSERDVERIKTEVERRVRPLGHAVYAIVNYRGSRIDPGIRDSYRRMVEALEASCYLGVTRYGMSGLIPEPDIDCRVDAPDHAGNGDRHARTTLLAAR